MSFLQPTEKEFVDMRSHYEGVWSNARASWEEADRFVEMRYDVWDRRDEKQVNRTAFRSPRISNIVMHATNSQSAYEPRVHREPIDGTEGGRADADEMEKALTLALISTARKNTTLTWKQVFRYLFMYDYAVLKVGAELRDWQEPDKEDFSDASLWRMRHAQWERGRLHYNPLTLDAPHPSRVFLDPVEKVPPFAIERRRMESGKVQDLVMRKRRTGREVKDFPSSNRPFELVEIDEYWSAEWHYVFHGGDLLYKEPNLYNAVLFSHGFGGHGWEGQGEDGTNPDKLGRTMLAPIYDLAVMESQQMSTRHQVLMRFGWAPMTIKEGYEEDLAFQLAKNGIVATPSDGTTPGYITPLNMPTWLFNEEATLDRNFQDATFPKVIEGMRPTGVDTASGLAILKHAAGEAFKDAQHQVEDFGSFAAQSFLRVVETLNYGEHIPTGGLRFNKYHIRPSKIQGDYNAEVTFEVVDPIMLMQEEQLALTEVQAGVRSMDSFLSVRRVEDKTRERNELLRDQLMRDPAVHRYLTARVAAEMGLSEALDQLAGDEAKQREIGVGGGVVLNDQSLPGPIGEGARAEVNALRKPIGGVEGDAPKPPSVRRS